MGRGLFCKRVDGVRRGPTAPYGMAKGKRCPSRVDVVLTPLPAAGRLLLMAPLRGWLVGERRGDGPVPYTPIFATFSFT